MAAPLHTDLDLFRRIATGDESAFREIFYQYGPRIHPFVYDIVKSEAVAREIVQETFLRLWLKREELTTIENPGSWLYRIASNLALTQFKRRQTEMRILSGLSGQEGHDAVTETFDARDLQRIVQRAVDQLPSQRQRIYRLSREQGWDRKAIADALGISEHTVKNQLRLSLREIQDFIRQASGYYIPTILILSALSSGAIA